MNLPERNQLAKDAAGGNLSAAVPILADWLTEHGDARGPRLKLRWRRWLLARKRIEASLAAALARQQQQVEEPFRKIVERVRAAGGTASLSVTVVVDDTVLRDHDNVFRDYVARLMMEQRDG